MGNEDVIFGIIQVEVEQTDSSGLLLFSYFVTNTPPQAGPSSSTGVASLASMHRIFSSLLYRFGTGSGGQGYRGDLQPVLGMGSI